jgi:hypothetical protein
MTNGDAVMANQDLLDQQPYDLLALDGIERIRIGAQARQKRR